MDFGWIPETVREINQVPAFLQIGFLGLAYLAVIRLTQWHRRRKSDKDSDKKISPTASSTRGAVEELRAELLPVLGKLTDAISGLEKTVTALNNTVEGIKDVAKENGKAVVEMKNAMRDVQEQMRRVADIEIALAGKIDANTERMVEIKTTLANTIRQEMQKVG